MGLPIDTTQILKEVLNRGGPIVLGMAIIIFIGWIAIPYFEKQEDTARIEERNLCGQRIQDQKELYSSLLSHFGGPEIPLHAFIPTPIAEVNHAMRAAGELAEGIIDSDKDEATAGDELEVAEPPESEVFEAAE